MKSRQDTETNPHFRDDANRSQRSRERRLVRFFTVPDIAESLGVSTRTVRRWIAANELVPHRFKSVLRIAADDLQAFLDRHRKE
jgi:excisionase family DNA binding protein